MFPEAGFKGGEPITNEQLLTMPVDVLIPAALGGVFDREMAKAVAERKKELERIYTSLSAKRLDLEDAERSYRESAR